MPHEHDEQRDHQRKAGGREEFRGPRGLHAGVSHLALRGEWSAWWRDAQGRYRHEVFGTRAEALDELRRQGMWEGLPDA